MMKVMITGAAGFIGRYLADYCVQAGCSVLGLHISEVLPSANGATLEYCDIRDFERLRRLIATFRPDRIFHLAAQSYPTVSLGKPHETMDINAGGTINLYECLRAEGISPLVVVACSSAEYGPVAASDLPVREDHPLRPMHPYGVSKVAQDLLAAQYFYNYSLPCVRVRIFNTTGPGKVGDVSSDIAKRVVELELGLRSGLLPVGNLNTRRAILDVRDLVRALWLSAEHCEVGEVYNVCGDQVYSVQELIECIRTQSTAVFQLQQDASLMRGCDEPVIAGDSNKFRRCTGWRQTIELTDTLRETLEWWRNHITSDSLQTQAAQARSGGI